MKKILLINPSMKELYTIAKVRSSVPNYPPLNLLTIATPLLDRGYDVKILDLLLYENIFEKLRATLKDFKPEIVGITFTTPLYSQVLKIVEEVKSFNPNILVVAGGVHISSDTENTLRNSKIDIAVIGEGDFTLQEILSAESLKNVNGIGYKEDDKIILNDKRPFIKNLDDLPFPAFNLININDYNVPHTYCRQNPVATLETSRGCVYGCIYCNKSVFGRTFRAKTPERVIKDVEKLVDLGFKEIHILDDGFTTDIKRAEKICKLLMENKIELNWNCPNGIRADRVNEPLLRLMKENGFYRVAFGVESGNQKILDNINKGVKLSDIEKSFELCRKIGIETTAFFMFGLPGETEENLKETIKFAKKIKPDIAKFDILIPYPSTPIYNEWKDRYIISNNWDDYGIYKEKQVYSHPNLPWSVLTKYMSKSYKDFYIAPDYILMRFFKGLKHKTLLKDIKIFLDTKW